MKKNSLWILTFLILLTAGFIPLKRYCVTWMMNTVQSSLDQLDARYVKIKTHIEPDTCRFLPCVTLKNTTVSVLNQDIESGDIVVTLLPAYPLSIDIQTQESPQIPHLVFKASLTGSEITLTRADLKLGDFSAILNGTFDTQTQHAKGALQTINLASFALPFLPQETQFLASLFLSNAPQTLSVHDENGWLTVQGLPLFRLK